MPAATETTDSKPRSGLLDWMKGILIVLVSTGHVLQYGGYLNDGAWDDPLFKTIYMFHMPFFVGISGYLAKRALEGSPVVALAVTKARALLLPTLVWAATYALIHLFSEAQRYTPSNLGPRIFDDALVRLWFLWTLFECFVLCALLLRLCRNAWVACGLANLLVWLLPGTLHVHYLQYLLPFFQLGYLANRIDFRRWTRARLAAVGGVALAGFAGCYLAWDHGTYIYGATGVHSLADLARTAVRYLGGFTGSVALAALLAGIYPRVAAGIATAVQGFGRDSIYIYIIQSYLFLAILQLAMHLPRPVSNVGLTDLICCAGGVLLTAVCAIAGGGVARSRYAALLYFGRALPPRAGR